MWKLRKFEKEKDGEKWEASSEDKARSQLRKRRQITESDNIKPLPPFKNKTHCSLLWKSLHRRGPTQHSSGAGREGSPLAP